MKIVSFSWTWPALFFGAKLMTCRDWTADYGLKMARADVVEAWTYLPRTKKPEAVPIARLKVESVRYERVCDGDTDIAQVYVDEGFAYLRHEVGMAMVNRARSEQLPIPALWVSMLSDFDMRRIIELTDPEAFTRNMMSAKVLRSMHWVFRYSVEERYDTPADDHRARAYRRLGLPTS